MSGEIKIEIDKIIWKYKDENIVEILFDDISVIGEYTFESFSDDWFMVFVTKNGSWKRISMFAENVNDLLNVLSQKFDAKVGETQLANSTKWNSIIGYPNSLRGKKLFTRFEKEIILENDVQDFISASL